MVNAVLGIDIGGTNTELGIVDEDGNILDRDHMSTITNCDVNIYIDQLAAKMAEIISRQKEVKVKAIGIGAPNGNYYQGSIDNAPNLGWGKKVPIISLLKNHFPDQIFALTNDANAAAVGEMIFGGAKMMKDFIMLTLGTGVGSGIVSNGSLVLGYDGLAGELGHLTAVPDGRECGCGHHGCVETYCSATGIKKTVVELMATTRTSSILREMPYNDITAKAIFDAAEEGDELALEAFDYTGEILGKSIADMITFSSPEAIFLFGGLAQAGDYIFEPTRKYLKQYQRSTFSREIKIIPSKLSGASIAIMGSAAVAFQEITD